MKYLFYAVAALVLFASPAASAPIAGLFGELWDQNNTFERRFIGEVEAFVNDPANTPDATFRSTEVNYPRGMVAQNPIVVPFDDFLGDDSDSLSVVSGPTFEPGNDFIMRLSGFITLDAGLHTFAARVDDGMLLKIDGQEIFRLRVDGSDVTSYSNLIMTTVALDGGRMPIELIYFDNAAANFGVRVDVDGKPIGGDMISTGRTSVVPLPASAWLLITGLLGLASFRRSRVS
ncbi:VPLPA-CTERM sorting domain-containing protein [Roseibium sp. HPY-6]|uniref:VPLPA-CTERM sorting domain-containing protein n=1 Tax=Roseibium sp. HPY-6 TaxID=3229852 RepID=UPI00338FE251